MVHVAMSGSAIMRNLHATIVIAATLVCACGGSDRSTTGPRPSADSTAQLKISPRSDSLFIGQQRQLTLEDRNAYGDLVAHPHTVTWSTGNPAVARVDSAGGVTASGAGQAWIRAGVGGITDSVLLRVIHPVGHIQVTASQRTLVLGTGAVVGAILTDTTGATVNRAVSWSSSDANIVTVTPAGSVFGHNTGTAVIRAARDSVMDTVRLTIVQPVATIILSASLDTLDVEDTAVVTVTLKDAAGTILSGLPFAYQSFGVAMDKKGGIARPVDLGAAEVWVSTATGLSTAFGSLNLFVGHKMTGFSMGYGGTCSIRVDGRVVCQGDNTNGAVGDASANPSGHAALIADTAKYVAISPLFDATPCAVRSTGVTTCWGLNDANQAGVPGNVPAVTTPTPVTGAPTFASVTSFGRVACGLTAAGVAWCWGANYVGQLGRGTSGGSSATPAPVFGSQRFSAIVMENVTTCGLGTDSLAYCWGSSDDGQTGQVASVVPIPTPVPGGLHFKAITAAGVTACGLTAPGDVWCWGSIKGTGALVQMPGGPFVQIARDNSGHTCGLTTANAVQCLGASATVASPTPIASLQGGGLYIVGRGTDGRFYELDYTGSFERVPGAR